MDGVKLSWDQRIRYSMNILLRQNTAYHILFWTFFYIILILLDNHDNIGFRMLKEGVNISFFALIVYINIYFLFPLYNKNKSLILHVLLLGVCSALITPIKMAALYLISGNYTDIQEYILDNMVAIFLSTIFIGFVSSIYSIMNDWIRTKQEKIELHHRSMQTELKFLRTQINPHFLFNTLNSLYALTLKKSDKAPEVVLKISEAMRYMLYECNERFVPLEKEVHYIENYLELERLRHGDDTHIQYRIVGKIKDQKIAPLIFITFIENCFKHGFNNRIDDRWIDIQIHIEDDFITLKAANSNSPIPAAIGPKNSGGVGLVNVRKRLDLLYTDRYELKKDISDSEYRIELKLKLIAHTL